MIRIEPTRLLSRLLFLGQEMIFPRFCGSCQKEGSFLCESCRTSLSQSRRQSQVCGHCGIRETPSGRVCLSCSGSVSYDGIFAALHYDDPRVAHIIHLFKYRFVRELGWELGRILAAASLQSDIPLPDAILPVPLHPRRKRWRGWNQSVILAESLVRNFPQDIAPPISEDLLVRTRFTTPQMSLKNREFRKENVRDAFQANRIDDIRGKNFWIIDDVAASGATIAACAKTLKELGANQVFGLVVAR